MKKPKVHNGRDQLRKTYWPDDSKAVSDKHKPSRTYIELLARHRGEGVIEMKHEGQHAYAAGHIGPRAIRTWKDHMRALEKAGFIKSRAIGGQEFAYVLLPHPTAVDEELRTAGKITDPKWFSAYLEVQRESKEPTFEDRKQALAQRAKVISIKQLTYKKKSHV